MEQYNNLKNKILAEISEDKNAIKSRWIFIFKNILKIFIIALLSIIIVFLTTLFMYFRIAPPIYIICIVLSAIVIEIIFRGYKFAYKRSMLYTFCVISFLLLCTSYTLNALRIQEMVHKNYFIRPIHDNFDPNLRKRDIQLQRMEARAMMLEMNRN